MLPACRPRSRPQAHRYLVPGLRARRLLDPGLRTHCRCLLPRAVDTVTPPPWTLTLPHSELTAAVDLNPTSLRARHRCPLPQVPDTAFDEGATPPLPHYHCRVNVCRNVNEI
jgi:hypothetical protein